MNPRPAVSPLRGLVFVGDPCHDHSTSSGYHQLCSLFPEAGWLRGRALVEGRRSWYRRTPGAEADPTLFHVLYGDSTSLVLPPVLRREFPQAKIVCTAHQPVRRTVLGRIGLEALHAADVVLALARSQAAELIRAGLGSRVQTIPHGLWVRAFQSAKRAVPRQRDAVMLVGRHLRDAHAAAHVVTDLTRRGVRVVAPGRHPICGDAPPLGLHGVEMPGRVSEAELIELYDRSAALLLPLLDGTASNALLEAMAVGCPVVCPEIPALVDDYLGDSRDAYVPGRHDMAVDRLLTYLHTPQQRVARSAVLAGRAKAFDWDRLRPQYERMYRKTMSANIGG